MRSTRRWGSGHSHAASTTKEAEGGMEGGASDCGGTASPSILFGKKKKKLLKRKIKREQHKQLYDAWAQAQNWPALLGSHCRRRTMDGSLLAPRMNSSRESLPRKQEAGAQVSGGRWQLENSLIPPHLGGSEGSPGPCHPTPAVRPTLSSLPMGGPGDCKASPAPGGHTSSWEPPCACPGRWSCPDPCPPASPAAGALDGLTPYLWKECPLSL